MKNLGLVLNVVATATVAAAHAWRLDRLEKADLRKTDEFLDMQEDIIEINRRLCDVDTRDVLGDIQIDIHQRTSELDKRLAEVEERLQHLWSLEDEKKGGGD